MEKKSLMKKITGSREALLAVVLIVLFVIVTAINPSFLTPKSLMDMLKNNAVTMVMSLGMLCGSQYSSLWKAFVLFFWQLSLPTLSANN